MCFWRAMDKTKWSEYVTNEEMQVKTCPSQKEQQDQTNTGIRQPPNFNTISDKVIRIVKRHRHFHDVIKEQEEEEKRSSFIICGTGEDIENFTRKPGIENAETTVYRTKIRKN